MRLFLAIDLPAGLAAPLSALQDRFRDAEGLRFTDPEAAHVTLKFLGEVDPGRREAAAAATEAALEAAGVGPFEATVGGLGVFPSLDYISVVWTGLRAGGAEATRLHEAIEREAVARGFDPEDHEFTPHVTLARMDDARGKELVRRVVRGADPTVGSFRAGAVRLKESRLSPSGPTYGTLREFPLGGG